MIHYSLSFLHPKPQTWLMLIHPKEKIEKKNWNTEAAWLISLITARVFSFWLNEGFFFIFPQQKKRAISDDHPDITKSRVFCWLPASHPVECLHATEILSPPCGLHLYPRCQARCPVEHLSPRGLPWPGFSSAFTCRHTDAISVINFFISIKMTIVKNYRMLYLWLSI